MAGNERKRGNRELKKPKKQPVAVAQTPPVKPGATPARAPREA